MRSRNRERFLSDVFTTFLEGETFAMVANFVESPLYDSEVERYYPAKIYYLDEEIEESHTVTIETVARGLSRLSKGMVEFMEETTRKRLNKVSRSNDASEIDCHDAAAIVEVGLFGEVRY